MAYLLSIEVGMTAGEHQRGHGEHRRVSAVQTAWTMRGRLCIPEGSSSYIMLAWHGKCLLTADGASVIGKQQRAGASHSALLSPVHLSGRGRPAPRALLPLAGPPETCFPRGINGQLARHGPLIMPRPRSNVTFLASSGRLVSSADYNAVYFCWLVSFWSRLWKHPTLSILLKSFCMKNTSYWDY